MGHQEWSNNCMINVTPTLFLNNKKLPLDIQFEDLKYYFLRFPEQGQSAQG